MDNKLSGIIKFQHKYKFYKDILDKYDDQYKHYFSIIQNIISNFNYINNYISNNIINNNIYTDLQKLVNNVKYEKINFRYMRNNNKTIDDIANDLYNINKNIINIFNHICVSNLFLIGTIFDFNINNFNMNDTDKFNFLLNYFSPVKVWCSLYKDFYTQYKDNEKRTLPEKKELNNLIGSNAIIIGDVSLTDFFSNLTNMIINQNLEDKENIDINEIKSFFNGYNDNIVISDITSDNSIYKNNGICVYIKINDIYYKIEGILYNDMFDMCKNNSLIKNKVDSIKNYIYYDILTVPKPFKDNYLDILSLKDILLLDKKNIGIKLKKKYTEYKTFRGKHLDNLITEFLLSNKQKKIDTLTTLFLGKETEHKIAFLLYDIMKMKDTNNISDEILKSLHYTIRCKLDNTNDIIKKDIEKVSKLVSSEIPYEKRISLMNVDDSIKSKAMEKYKSMKNNLQGDNKAQSWLDGILKLPFGIYKTNKVMEFKNEFIKGLNDDNITSYNDIEKYVVNDDKLLAQWETYKKNKLNYIKNVRQKLDDAVYGHKEAKTQLERIIAQWINGESKGEVLGLCGPPGTGKTSLAKNGLAKCLVDDDGNNRPFAFLPIGGSVNGSTLVGHNYTYVGSTWGRIADILMVNSCMNPIIFIDEVDKVSNTEHGREIISVLTHLTDLTQNDNFEDKYFSGIPLDLSKALIVFSFNDISLLDPILRDRITVVETKPYNIKEKIHILRDYVIPEVLKTVGFNKDEIIFNDDVLEFLITTYTNEAGVRRVKEKLVEMIRDINLKLSFDNNIEFPFNVSQSYIEEMFKNKPKMRIKKINEYPEVGLVNGLYATTSGVGGLTIIQAMKYPSEKLLELTTTGQQGDVMKESVNYAFKIAYSLLDDMDRDEILENPKFGIHIHTPEAATKKDGPSAGAAMTLAIYSLLTGKQVKNNVAMTGEIDLMKNVTAIGGVYAKLMGAKKAGVKLALIPEENREDLIILREEGISPEDETFKVHFISNIYDVIKYAIV
jgi:ATP-dependent Lon protease